MNIVIQKIIADSGHCSRRQAEALIKKGVVTVNGERATLGDRANPERDEVKVRDKVLSAITEKIYIRLNKPLDYTCTNRKFPGEKNIFDLVKLPQRLFTIGRLDKNSRGLVILTNDGDLSQKLSHPKFRHEKVYQIRVRGELKYGEAIAKKLFKGVDIGEGDGVVRVKKSELVDANTFLVTLEEGRKRQIRRMFKAVNLHVVDLKRISVASVGIGGLKEGQWEYLAPNEVKKLK